LLDLALIILSGCDILLGDTAGPGDSAPAGDTTGDTAPGGDSGDTSGDDTAPAGLRVLADPCQGAGTPYGLAFVSDEQGFVGCGNGAGLHATADGGESFTRLDRGDLYVFQVVPEPAGSVLVCGHDYADPDSTLLYRYDGEFRSLLRYGTNGTDPGAVYFSNCGVVASDGGGRMVAASNTAGDITWSEDDGTTWHEAERYWEDANLAPDGYAFYYMLNLVFAGGAFWGAGSQIVEPPVVFGPSEVPEGSWYNFHAHVVDDGVYGEIWALASPDDGRTLFVGGRDQLATSVASGFLYASEPGAETWRSIPLPDGVDILHDLSFAPDGLHGVAVGHRYPVAQGGYVLVTDDGGVSWSLVDEWVPLLQSAFAGDGHYWVAGDGFLARGQW
jgi:hypothetical protein